LLASHFPQTATERKRNNFKDVKDFYLKAKARIWPGLSYMCHIRLPESQGQNLAWTVLYVPYSLKAAFPKSCASSSSISPGTTTLSVSSVLPYCSRPNMAHRRQSRPDSGLDFQVKVLKSFKSFPLRSESTHTRGGTGGGESQVSTLHFGNF